MVISHGMTQLLTTRYLTQKFTVVGHVRTIQDKDSIVSAKKSGRRMIDIYYVAAAEGVI